AYLMYGFPTQTVQETIDSLEVVRQMFDTGILQSAFWHRFAMTAHSPVGLYPDQFKVKTITKGVGTFANNDLEHLDPSGADHDLFAAGLRKSLYNFMHGIGLDHQLQSWFEYKIPDTTLEHNLIEKYLDQPQRREMKASHMIIWIGGPVSYDTEQSVLNISTMKEAIEIECPLTEGQWLASVLESMTPKHTIPFTYQHLKEDYDRHHLEDFTLFWYGSVMEELKEIGLLVL
ncbi:MAG: radical SAM protein, partial [Saprospiraceae bacterium]